MEQMCVVFVFELSQNASGFNRFFLWILRIRSIRSACASSNESLFYLSISNLSVRWNKQFWYGASTEWRQVQRNTIACSWEFQQFSATKNICFRKQQSFPSTKACLIWSRENVMKQHRMLACNHHGGQIFGPKSDTAMLRGCCYWFENVHVCTVVLRYSLNICIFTTFSDQYLAALSYQ